MAENYRRPQPQPIKTSIKRPLGDVTNYCWKKAGREKENLKNLPKVLEKHRTNYGKYEYWDVKLSWQIVARNKKNGKVESFASPGYDSDVQESFSSLTIMNQVTG